MDDLVLVMIFWFRIIKYGWLFMPEIIASSFLRIGNGLAIVVKYATTVEYIGSQSFPQILENHSWSRSNAYNNLISSKSTHQLNRRVIDDSTENMSGITDGHQNYEKCEKSTVADVQAAIQCKQKVKYYLLKQFQTQQNMRKHVYFVKNQNVCT